MIQNEVTKELLFKAIGGKEQLSVWPGQSFSTTTDDGQALLGSPNGSGVAFMVAQYRRVFAGKVVDKVVVFDPAGSGSDRPDDKVQPCIAIHIADKPEG